MTSPAPANMVDLAAPTVARRWRRAEPPFVLVNMAMTADGKIATANRAVSSFGSRRDLAHLYELRATVDAVMCGARTVAGGEVLLGPGGVRYQRARLRRGLAEFNLRVVVSGSGSLAPTLPLFRHRFSPIVVLTTARAGRSRLRRLAAVADEVVIGGEPELDLAAAVRWLAARWGVRRLLCEGGGELNAAMFRAGLVNELHLTICPLVFGGRDAPTIASGVGARMLADATRLELQRYRRVGDELFCVFTTSAKPAASE
jgi:riboflavin-specific deaminase-like protein